MNIQVGEQGDTPANNWSVVRLRQNILSNSDIGAFVFNRDSAAAGDWNRSAGFDYTFRFLQRRLTVTGFAMKSQTPGPDEDNLAASFEAVYEDSLYSFRGTFVTIEDNFQNDFGFVPRSGIRKSVIWAGVRPRPNRAHIREIFPRVSLVTP